MPITVRVLDIGALKQFVTKDDMKAVAERLLALQKERITSGIGSSGRRMKKLSKEYAEETGRTTRTLYRTGRMLNSRSVLSASATKAEIGFRGAPKYAYVNEATTPFVKATKAEREFLRELLSARIRKRLARQLAMARAGKG